MRDLGRHRLGSGWRVWEQGPRGFIDNFSYDSVTGGRVQMIEDVDAPSFWTRPLDLPPPLTLVTDYQVDNRGRQTQALGPVHLIDGVPVRTAKWTVYDDADFTTIQAQGYATGMSPNYTFNSLGPVSITVTNDSGQVTNNVQAGQSTLSGKPTISNTFPQSTWTRWINTLYDEGGRIMATRAYYNIPGTGAGTPAANYNETDYDYDALNRINRIVTPGGTIRRATYDPRGNVTGSYVGTNDNGATDSDPTGGGATGNNMVLVNAYQYDGGGGGGDGNLTQSTNYVDDTTARVTEYGYDWQDRQITITGELSFFQQSTYDNLDNVVQVDTYDGSAAGTLLTRKQILYDTRNNIYQAITVGVDPDTGTVGNSLISNNWYDAAGNQIKSLPTGSQAFTKTMYDSQARVYAQYIGYYVGGGQEPIADVPVITTSNIVFQQTLATYDHANNPIEVDTYQRNHNASGGGALNATYTGTQPLARTTYVANYFDGIGRRTTLAIYGTNADQQFIRPATAPLSSDTVLVASYAYDDAGNLYQSTDAAGSMTRKAFDALGHVITRISNYTGSSPGNSTDTTVQFTYNADGNLSTLTAVNPTTGDQVTTYQYGTTIPGSAIASKLLLSATIYPDAATSNDRVIQTYNRQSQIIGLVDQNGTTHQYLYDMLGRRTDDLISILGTGGDASIQRISQTYDVRRLPFQVTSFADIAGTNIVNQIENEYNSFLQLSAQYQEHGGTVTSASPVVQYNYSDGSTNTIRPTSLVYPNGRVISYGYGAAGGDSDMLSRIATFLDVTSGVTLVNYTYLGFRSFVQVNYPQPSITYNLATGSGNNPYSGVDQFGRVIDCLWQQGTSSIADQIQYGYNQASSRVWRADPIATSQSPPVYQDELYNYDGLQRLVNMSRGQLTNGNSAITNLAIAQQWSLDAAGNWPSFVNTDTQSPANNLSQQRTSTLVNEITQLTSVYGASWATPAYDAAGNMTTIPQPNAPPTTFTATYDAWNRLISLAGTATYAYDGLNRRISRIVSGQTRDFYYSDKWQVLEQQVTFTASTAVRKTLRRTLRTPSANTIVERQFVWGLRYIDDLILRARDLSASGSLTEWLYALQDDNWNITAIANTAGLVQERYRYGAYGTRTVLGSDFSPLSDSLYSWDIGYSAYAYDPATGLYHVRYRYLHPGLGVWLSRDPIGYFGGLASLYEYVGDNPINLLDPFGLQYDGGPLHGEQQPIDRMINPIVDKPTGLPFPFIPMMGMYGPIDRLPPTDEPDQRIPSGPDTGEGKGGEEPPPEYPMVGPPEDRGGSKTGGDLIQQMSEENMVPCPFGGQMGLFIDLGDTNYSGLPDWKGMSIGPRFSQPF